MQISHNDREMCSSALEAAQITTPNSIRCMTSSSREFTPVRNLSGPKPYDLNKFHAWLSQACKGMKFGAVTVPKGYEAAFQRAIWTFLHQRVFDDVTKQVVHLTPLPEGGLASPPGIPDAVSEGDSELRFLGPPLPDDIASKVARGRSVHLHASS